MGFISAGDDDDAQLEGGEAKPWLGLGGQAVVAEEGGVGRRLNEVEGVVQERFVDLAS